MQSSSDAVRKTVEKAEKTVETLLDSGSQGDPDRAIAITSVRSSAAPRVLDAAWHRLGLHRVLDRDSDRSPGLERAVFAMVAYCALAGRTTASVPEWVRQDVSVRGVGTAAVLPWGTAIERLGDVAVRRELEQLARTHAGRRVAYIASDPTEPGGEFALAVSSDRWPLLMRDWPREGDPEQVPTDWIRLLSQDLSVPVLYIRARQPESPVSDESPDGLQQLEWPGRGHVYYRRRDEGQTPGTRLIVVRPRVRDWPWRQADRLLEVSGDGVPDDQVVLGYFDAMQVRRDFADLMARPQRAPFTVSPQAALAWPFVSWMTLLLTRQVEKDAKLPWSEVRTELQRVQHVTLSQAGRDHIRRTPFSSKQRGIWDSTRASEIPPQ